MFLVSCDTSLTSTTSNTEVTTTTTTATSTSDTSVTTASTDTTTGTTTSTLTTASTSTTTISTLRVFTLVELATYNGDNGTTAYMAVSGVVYDVSNDPEWNNGWHQGMHLAGTDATLAFAGSPHTASILSTLPIVGSLGN
ncbi:MAG: hypothetical protein KJ971_08145 [Firmicutes bacterium]|nr:hypothetical protein [Bacillota bacterium]